jgi:hypothetical protein
VANEIKTENLKLLIGLRDHLDHAERLRQQLDRVLRLATIIEPAKRPKTPRQGGPRGK